jgi:hypothetical protein
VPQDLEFNLVSYALPRLDHLLMRTHVDQISPAAAPYVHELRAREITCCFILSRLLVYLYTVYIVVSVYYPDAYHM